MNFSPNQIILEAQRGRQWCPLLTQQLRLRHLNQIWCLNLNSDDVKNSNFYFTVHLTAMSAPFFTSESTNGPHPKWQDLTFNKFPSASAVVLRIWRHQRNGCQADTIMLTWGLHLSGLVYIGNRATDIKPSLFNSNAVIFCMFGSYFTSNNSINGDGQRLPTTLLQHTNMADFPQNKTIVKVISTQYSHNDIKKSYSIEKLRKLHYLEVQIKNKILDVEQMQEKISQKDVWSQKPENTDIHLAPTKNMPQLLTMNCLNRMLQEKPTRMQKQEMFKLNKQIEVAKFRTKLLSQEQEKKLVTLRKLRNCHSSLVESNTEKEHTLLEGYHTLSREKEKLKEYRKVLLQHRELLVHTNSQLQQRKRQLLQQLLWIYPIKQLSDNRYLVNDIHLPNADLLSDATDDGISVALGSVTHILSMCSTFLQVPLRYPVTHYGSRSTVTDQITANLPEREFPLFTKGKDRMQFTYGVYLLNKNIAQLRWLYSMHTPDLKLTLANLLSFLQGYKELKQERFVLMKPAMHQVGYSDTGSTDSIIGSGKSSPTLQGTNNRMLPPLNCYETCSTCSDPILDCLRHEKWTDMSERKTPVVNKKIKEKPERNHSVECGPGLSEILAVPEAYLSRQMSGDSFRHYLSSSDKSGRSKYRGYKDSPLVVPDQIINKKNMESKKNPLCCDINISTNSDINRANTILHSESVEEGTDLLNLESSLSDLVVDTSVCEECTVQEVPVSEGFINNREVAEETATVTDEADVKSSITSTTKTLISKDQQEFMQNWLRTGPALVCSDKNLYPDEFLGATSAVHNVDSPLTARTDALLTTKSFNLVKPKY